MTAPGIWERRRSAIFKNKRMVKIKDKDKGKAKPCKTEEDPPPASGKQLAGLIARLSSEVLGLVSGHLPSSTLQNWAQSLGAQSTQLCG